MDQWAAVWCSSGSELSAAAGIAALAVAGMDVYAPQCRERVSGRVRTAMLFPRYIFARLVEGWGGIKRVRGVSGIVSMAGEPCHLNDEVIAAIRAKEDHEGFIWLADPEPRVKYKMGQKVRITAGAYSGYKGIYKGCGARQRERVLLEMMGRKVAVDLPLSDLAAA